MNPPERIDWAGAFYSLLTMCGVGAGVVALMSERNLHRREWWMACIALILLGGLGQIANAVSRRPRP